MSMENSIKRLEDIKSEEEHRKEDIKIEGERKKIKVEATQHKKRKIYTDYYNSTQKKSQCIEISPSKPDVKFSCKACGRKLRITNNFSCRCGDTFCIMHRFYDQHNCNFDYKNEAIEKLRVKNPKIIRKKLGDM